MSYVVIEPFKDREDGLHFYDTAGTAYPREGFTPSEEWLNALASADNRAKRPFIEKVEEPVDTDEQSSAEDVEEVIEADDEKKSLEDFTVEELKGFLDDLNVKYKSRATKPELIKQLETELAKED